MSILERRMKPQRVEESQIHAVRHDGDDSHTHRSRRLAAARREERDRQQRKTCDSPLHGWLPQRRSIVAIMLVAL